MKKHKKYWIKNIFTEKLIKKFIVFAEARDIFFDEITYRKRKLIFASLSVETDIIKQLIFFYAIHNIDIITYKMRCTVITDEDNNFINKCALTVLYAEN